MLRPFEAIECAALALRRTSGAWLSHEHAWESLDHRNRRTVVDQALRRGWRTDPLLDDRGNLENSRAPDVCVDAVADLHVRRRFGRRAIDANVPAAARRRGRRTGLVDPDGPQPDIYTGRFDGLIMQWRIRSLRMRL